MLRVLQNLRKKAENSTSWVSSSTKAATTGKTTRTSSTTNWQLASIAKTQSQLKVSFSRPNNAELNRPKKKKNARLKKKGKQLRPRPRNKH